MEGFSCTPSEIKKITLEKIKTSGDYISDKSRAAYSLTRESLGIKEEQSALSAKPMTVSKKVFGTLANGAKINEFRLINDKGMEVSILEYGSTIQEIIVPDRNGKKENISLGFNNLEDYVEKSPYFGCIAGRYANRIAKGKFLLDGKEYQLATNNGLNHLHGGDQGFDKRIWTGKPLEDGIGVTMTYQSIDGKRVPRET